MSAPWRVELACQGHDGHTFLVANEHQDEQSARREFAKLARHPAIGDARRYMIKIEHVAGYSTLPGRIIPTVEYETVVQLGDWREKPAPADHVQESLL